MVCFFFAGACGAPTCHLHAHCPRYRRHRRHHPPPRHRRVPARCHRVLRGIASRKNRWCAASDRSDRSDRSVSSVSSVSSGFDLAPMRKHGNTTNGISPRDQFVGGSLRVASTSSAPSARSRIVTLPSRVAAWSSSRSDGAGSASTCSRVSWHPRARASHLALHE